MKPTSCTEPQKKVIPNVVVAVRARVLISGRYFTADLPPQAKVVTDTSPITRPKLNWKLKRSCPIIIKLPNNTRVAPIRKFLVKSRLSKIISKEIAAKGINAAARPATTVEVKTCVTTRRREPVPKLMLQ